MARGSAAGLMTARCDSLACFVIPDVQTNSTLLQTALRADFPLPFAKNEV